MGRGDKRTTKGKTFRASYGNSRSKSAKKFDRRRKARGLPTSAELKKPATKKSVEKVEKKTEKK